MGNRQDFFLRPHTVKRLATRVFFGLVVYRLVLPSGWRADASGFWRVLPSTHPKTIFLTLGGWLGLTGRHLTPRMLPICGRGLALGGPVATGLEDFRRECS